MKTFFKNLMPMLLLVAGLGISPNAWAWGWTQYVSQDPATVYVGKTVTLTMWLNKDGNNASYKRFGYGTTNSKAGLTWSENWTYKEQSGDNHKWEFTFTPTSAGTWYWSLWIGFGSSVGDNGHYYNNDASWNEGNGNFISSSITVLAIPQPTNQTATADKNTINLSWSKNTPGHDVMVVRSTSSTAPSPTGGTSYSVGSAIGSGTVVYKGNGTSYTDKDLATSTKYYYYFFSEHYSYYSTSVSANATTAADSWFLAGNGCFGNWGDNATIQLTSSATNKYTANVTPTVAAGEGQIEFKVYNKTTKHYLSYGEYWVTRANPNPTLSAGDEAASLLFKPDVLNTAYTFELDLSGASPVLRVTFPNSTIDLYKDGSFLKTIPATFGEAFNKNVLTLPDDTAKTGYIFGGFYDKNAASGGSQVISKTLAYGKNGTYGTNNSSQTWCYTETTATGYARYSAKTYTVTLPGGGGVNDQNGSIQVTFDSKTAKNFVTPTKEGYGIRSTNAFCADAGLTQGVFTQGGKISDNTNTYLTSGAWTYDWTDSKDAPTIYTAWVAQQYTLSLDDNNGTDTKTEKKVTYDAGTNLSQQVTIPSKTGQDFTGYWTNNDGTGTQLVGSDGYFLNEVTGYIKATKLWGYADNLTIYAGWANHVYNITYKDQGNTNFSGDWGATEHPETHTYNTKTTLVDAPNKTGYTFGGWFTSSNCEGAAITELGATAYTADITLYAKWNPTTTTITLYRNDGTDVTTTHVATYDGAATSITNLTDAVRTRTGYSHNGIYAAATGGSYILKYNSEWTFNSTTSEYATSTQWRYTGTTLNLYSHWSANKYTITFNQHEPTTAGDASATVTFDASVSKINTPTKENKIFSGYYTAAEGAGVQIFDAGGNLVANAAGGDPSVTYTSDGKWKYADNITLHAYWTVPAEQVVNFGITDGSALSYTLGTITAKVDGVAISSGDKVASGKEVVFEYSAAKGTIIKDINGTKLQNWYDGVNTSSATSYSITQNSCTLTVSASTVNAYAYAKALEYTVSTAVNPVGKGEVTSNNEFHCGPNLNTTLTAVNPDGYDFVNWTADENGKVQFTGDVNTSSIDVAIKEANHTVTANFKIHNYTITYTGLEAGSTHSNPETYTIETPTITFTPATSVLGHKFTEWSLATISTGSTGDQTITAQYGDVTLSAVASANIIEDKQATITPTLTAPPSTYYYQYTCASIATFNVGANGVATFNAPAAGNYTITLKVYEGASNTGVLLATTNVNITVNEDLSANWYIVGQSGLLPLQTDNWVRSENYRFSKPSKDAKSAYIDLVITEGQVNNTYEFKLQDCGVGGHPLYGWGESSGYEHIFTHTETWGIYSHNSNDNALKIIPKMKGTYRFSIDWTSGHNLTVTYPDEGHHMVTVDNGATSTKVQVNEFTETSLETSQYLNGMRFYRWVVTNAAGEDKSGSITINHSGNYSTHMHGATEDGLIVKATYTTQGIVYLNKQYIKNNWAGDVYVYFYKGAYWDEGSKGSGSKVGDKSNCISTGKQMTRVSDKSDIYYYDYSNDNLPNRDSHIAFLDQREDGYDNFVACQAIYRGDFQECSPMFVPRDWKSYYNEGAAAGRAVYYQEGYWRTYGSTEAGLSLVFWKGGNKTTIPFTADNANSNTFKATVNITDAGGNDSYFKLRCCGGDEGNQDYWYGCKSGMSATSCTNYRFYSGNNSENANCGIGLTSTGDYVFTLSLADGQVFVSVEYPLSNGDYRLVSVTNGKVHDNGMFYKSSTDRVDTASFFITNALTSVVKLQECTNATAVPAVWADVAGKSINTSEYATGIYNFTFTQSGENTTLAKLGEYDGDFYIRTAIAAGGWDAYKGSADNLLSYIKYGLDDSQPFKFTHAYTNWVDKGKNAKYCIANDYSLCISDTLVGDDIIGTSDGDDWLNKEGANIRFMWNKNTNEVKRAYIGGSTDDAARFLMLLRANGNMYNSSDVAIAELKFTDKNNWVYQADIKAEPGCAVKLTANYNAHTQYFIGADGVGAGSSKTIINSSTTGDTKHYTMRAVYDFKTNRLTAGWIPDDGPISSQIELGGDMLISRTHQGNAQQITFGTGGEVSEIQHIYGVLTLQKDVMAGTEKKSYKDKATNADYDKTMFWISFPFDVNISEIFGVDGYGKKWIMQKYRGDLRAQKGWFAETSTFWEYMDISEKLNAYEGYLFIVDANYFNTLDADVWKSSATEANFYFPSAEKNIGIINQDAVTITIPEHECKINRTFGDNNSMNHMITDSHWNVIGVPTFQNSTASTISEKDSNFKSYYAWVPTTNSYSAQAALGTNITFNTMQAYMIQYAGTITWENVSVVAKKAPYAYVDDKNYMIELFFNGNGAEDHTYINLADGAHIDFELNEDMMKIDNAGQPNIYSFAGAYNVAYNETTFDNQMVVLGVSAPKDGSYTFAMPKDFSGSAILVDLEEGTTTDLNVSNYSVDLNKGTYNNRFQLMLEVEAKTPTAVDNANGEWNADGKTKKLFINDNIYLINGGRIFNASGTKLR